MKDIPKIELHLHIEGAAPPAFIRGLAAERRVDLSAIFAEGGGYRFEGFAQFLRTYEAATSVLTGPEDYARLTRAVLEASAAHGVVYTEMFVSPDFCGGGDVGAWRDHLAAMAEAAEAMEPRITARFIVTCIRHLGPEAARAPALCAAETAGRHLRGFGMAGDEGVLHPRDFAWAFDCAREAGLHLTAHAGEWGGAASVSDTLAALAPERIGHGVRAIEDPALVDRLAEDGIVLEVCPGSNVALGVVPSWSAHPVDRLRERGVRVTVSTDDPPFFHTTMTREYERLADTFGWDASDFAAINRTALDAAFCDADTRGVVATRLDAKAQ